MSEDSTILFWDITNFSVPQKIGAPLQGHPGAPPDISFSPDGNLLASLGYDGTILVDVKTNNQVGVGDILTSPGNTVWVYQSLDKNTNQRAIHLMDAGTNKPIAPPFPGQNPIFNADGEILVYQTIDQTTGHTLLNIWDVINSKNIGAKIHGAFPTFSPDSKIMAFQTADSKTGKTFINAHPPRGVALRAAGGHRPPRKGMLPAGAIAHQPWEGSVCPHVSSAPCWPHCY